MATTKLGLPIITDNMTADVVRDMNALANGVDAKVGVANGLATLDTGGKVPTTQIPASIETTSGSTSKAGTAETNAINFAKSFGLGDVAKVITNTDLNALDATGFYIGTNLTNSPNAANLYYVINMKYGVNARHQMSFRNSNTAYMELFMRNQTNGAWTAWKQLETTEGAQAKVNALRAELYTQEVLWSGGVYPMAADTVTPAKKLSECRTGWILLWSDYDVGAGSNDYQFVSTFIPKEFPNMFPGVGASMYCSIPGFISEDKLETTIKQITVTDSTIKGNDINKNSFAKSDDAVLRRIISF
ncbi:MULTISPECIES: pyocin knob domain-containing protein [Peribacillus]|uniref:pyocin knob domain-containing protein n=1 Tax=Peribacillus TaxID=2675229 RepID=UPI001F4DB85A|nr:MULTISPECIES: pyocin knob domain-containing protein [unclassified Peribacillus]MCK1985158.1 pyocin knob domain-containing protein [Peribacillus sp. Aquil_B1]MCK2007192.1 pyocin knob domain-containing protein [Peribacillus sp. Aquil_B8]